MLQTSVLTHPRIPQPMRAACSEARCAVYRSATDLRSDDRLAAWRLLFAMDRLLFWRSPTDRGRDTRARKLTANLTRRLAWFWAGEWQILWDSAHVCGASSRSATSSVQTLQQQASRIERTVVPCLPPPLAPSPLPCTIFPSPSLSPHLFLPPFHTTTQHNTTQHNTTQHSTAQHNTTQTTTQHNTTQHNTTQHNITHNATHTRNLPSLPPSLLPFPSLPFPSLPFPSLPFPSLPFPSLPFPSLPFPSLPFPPTLFPFLPSSILFPPSPLPSPFPVPLDMKHLLLAHQ